MSETLWAVIIGGIIAIAATIPPLIYSHYHWKKEKKLEHLRAERRHKEEQYMQILSKLADCEGGGSWDWDLVSGIGLILPIEIGKEISNALGRIKGKKVVPGRAPEICGSIAPYMRKSLDEIDKEINKLMS